MDANLGCGWFLSHPHGTQARCSRVGEVEGQGTFLTNLSTKPCLLRAMCQALEARGQSPPNWHQALLSRLPSSAQCHACLCSCPGSSLEISSPFFQHLCFPSLTCLASSSLVSCCLAQLPIVQQACFRCMCFVSHSEDSEMLPFLSREGKPGAQWTSMIVMGRML